jgi:hypothetical protein
VDASASPAVPAAPDSRRRRRILGCLLPALVAALGATGAAHLHDSWTWGKLREKAAAVRIGMTKTEVLQAMGTPDDRADPDRWEAEKWDAWWYHARRLLRRNREIRIDFDPDRVKAVEEIPHEQIPFDSADWKRSTTWRRCFMVDDLLDRHDLSKLNRVALVDLLGEPPDSYMRGGGDLVWCLGPERSLFGVDNEWLVVNLNEDGSVKSVLIMTD